MHDSDLKQRHRIYIARYLYASLTHVIDTLTSQASELRIMCRMLEATQQLQQQPQQRTAIKGEDCRFGLYAFWDIQEHDIGTVPPFQPSS